MLGVLNFALKLFLIDYYFVYVELSGEDQNEWDGIRGGVQTGDEFSGSRLVTEWITRL